MHQFSSANDAIYRAGLDAKLATNASVFTNIGDDLVFLDAMLRIEGFHRTTGQRGKGLDSNGCARRTLIDISFTFRDRCSVLPAPGVVALCALGLRQKLVDLVDQRVINKLCIGRIQNLAWGTFRCAMLSHRDFLYGYCCHAIIARQISEFTMTSIQYQEKFNRIAEQTSFRLLNGEDQDFLKNQAMKYQFTLQELQLVSDMALDRLRWKEPGISAAWNQVARQSDCVNKKQASISVEKKKFFSGLRQQHESLRSGVKDYKQFSLQDKPKTQKPQLEIKVKSRLGLGRCPVASEKTRCCNLLTLDAVEKCGFDCSYCSIQSFYHGNKVTFDESFAEKLNSLELDPETTYHIGTGQSSDSLLWGNHLGVLDALSAFAAAHPNVILELKTKSRNIRWLLDHDYPPNIICTWSLNPQTIIEHEEHLTASLEQRIVSAQQIASKGRLVGFHFHPIVYYDGWADDYKNICSDITQRFPPDSVALLSLGTLTFTRSVMKTIRKRPLTSKILQMPMEEIAGKFSYPLDLKIEMFKTVFDALTPWHKKVFFYLCMEAQSLWSPVFGYEYQTNAELESAMKDAYFAKIRLIKDSQSANLMGN